jgi:hypothetical protein
MFDGIRRLRDKGYFPDTILDIGAYHGNWTRDAKGLYADCEYHLFEAIDYPELKRFDNDLWAPRRIDDNLKLYHEHDMNNVINLLQDRKLL